VLTKVAVHCSGRKAHRWKFRKTTYRGVQDKTHLLQVPDNEVVERWLVLLTLLKRLALGGLENPLVRETFLQVVRLRRTHLKVESLQLLQKGKVPASLASPTRWELLTGFGSACFGSTQLTSAQVRIVN